MSSQTLLDSARRSESGDAASEAWLDSIASEGVLAFLASTGNAELAGFDRRWREGWARFSEIWQHTVAAEDAWRKQPRPVAGVESARVVSFDDLVFGVSDRLVLPPREKVNGALLLALHDEPYAAALRGEVAGRQGEIAGFCPWYDALWQLVEKDSVAILVAKRMLPHARDDASAEIQRQAATKNVRVKIVDEARADVRVRLAEVLGVDADGFDLRTATRLLRALERFQEACHRALGLGFADAEYLSFCRGMEKISRHGLDVQDALTRCEEIHATNAIVMQPERMVLALLIAGIIGFILVFQAPWLAVALAMLATCAFGWRWYIGFQARERALAALRLLRLHAKGIVGGFISPQKTDTQRPGRPVA